jgi:hypothetical protein
MYERQRKGSSRWERISLATAHAMIRETGDPRAWEILGSGEALETAEGFIRQRPLYEGRPWAYGRSRPVVDERTRFAEDMSEGE